MGCILILSIQCPLSVPVATLIFVFARLPLLRNLRIFHVSSAAIPWIMVCLPNLTELLTVYHHHAHYPFPSTPLPRLQWLTIRMSSVDVFAPEQLWDWICSLVPHEGSLLSFSLLSFLIQEQIAIPLSFVTRLIRKHGQSLTQFHVVAYVTHEALVYLCRDCPALTSLECSVASLDMVRQVLSIPSVIAKRLLANDRKSYRTRQEPSYTPVRLVDPGWCRGYGT